jgi:hypothetical protein
MTKAQEQLHQQCQGGNGRVLRQLQLSRHMLPCMAAVLALCASYASRAVAAADARAPVSSSGIQDRDSNSRKETARSSSIRPRERQPQGTPRRDQSSSTAAGSSSSSNDTSVARQLQLVQLLGLAPELLGLEPVMGTCNKWPMAKSAGPKYLEDQGVGGCWCLALFGMLAHGVQNVVCRCRVSLQLAGTHSAHGQGSNWPMARSAGPVHLEYLHCPRCLTL